MTHTFTVTLTSERPVTELAEDLNDLITGAADGYVGDPDRPLGGSVVAVTSP